LKATLMIKTTIGEATTQLPELAEAAFRGEEVLITEDKDGNERVLKLVAIPQNIAGAQERGRPQFGSARGKIWMSDDFDEPLEEFEEYMR
jgi:antitoxin (DNA-binding transcriptional repressor) of toxin-antitoxin stability system